MMRTKFRIAPHIAKDEIVKEFPSPDFSPWNWKCGALQAAEKHVAATLRRQRRIGSIAVVAI
jgi:hypothetical protein